MSKRLLIVGGVAGGASCAARGRRLNEEAEIIIFERGPYVSFANCGLPYHVGGFIEERDKLILVSPERFKERFNIDVRLRHEVTDVDASAKKITVTNHETGERYEESYDDLLLSPGAAPIRPPLPGIDLPGIFTLRNIPDMDAINEWITAKNAKRAVVVGGGYIGLEMTESLHHRGLEVSLVEMLPQVMPPLDPEMVVAVQQHLTEKGVHLYLGSPVASFEAGGSAPLMVCNQQGLKFPADIVILAIGVKPETALAKKAGITIGERGGIRVDQYMRTSDPRIWAVGDAVEVKDYVTGEYSLIPLAGPANRQGRIAAANILTGAQETFRGTQGTAVCRAFDLTVAGTGANEKTLKRLGTPYEKIYIDTGSHAGYYPGSERIDLKLLFSTEDGRVLGAQAVGLDGIDKRIDVVATALQMKATVYDLAELELCYAPPYGSAKDAVNMAGFVAVDYLKGLTEIVHWEEVGKALRSSNPPFILDVRTQKEVEKGMIPGAKHIPVDELRDRIDELPKDREIWCHCATGVRSYIAERMLKQRGFKAKNIPGRFMSYDMTGVALTTNC